MTGAEQIALQACRQVLSDLDYRLYSDVWVLKAMLDDPEVFESAQQFRDKLDKVAMKG